MTRVKHAVASRKRRKRVLKKTKGYRGARSKLLRTAKETLRRAKAYAYKGRKLKKRDFRALWIARITAACKANDISYSRFIDGLKKAKITLNRKSLADLAVTNKTVFKSLVAAVKSQTCAKSK